MKSSGIIILLSILLSIGLSLTGTYLIIDNIVHPNGNLFEGVVLFSLGAVVLLLLVIASSLGTAIQTFTNVFTQQVEMQQTMTEYFSQSVSQKPKSIGDILGGIANLGESSISITNLETGETSTRPLNSEDSLGKINDLILNAINKNIKPGSPKELKDMNRSQLEKELSKAVKSDDFERANEIKQLLNKLDEGKNSTDL